MSEYCIQAAMFKLPIPLFKRFTHDFWILREVSNNTVIAQLHGLATSRKNGQIVPIGYSADHSLRAHCSVYDLKLAQQFGLQMSAYELAIHGHHTVCTGNDCLKHWRRAIDAVNLINKLDLNYPRGGFKIPLSSTINSNSIYHTFAQVMNVPLHTFEGFFHIGIQSSIYDKIKNDL
ncbi:hypothetical protein [Legionella cardiaca]|uniref:Uncharacterized protein n=1 Tax=Legionella cardiaca TaxID=1071983 RepID=A0ABY8AUU9_9GAMM|nr:hypothetical protein [Legionella cardiaca]WED43524.1 hypothetical protein PXX05_01760 [Legionella cardiaca]